MIRDFRKTAGMSVDEWLDALAKLAKGYKKDAAKLHENLRHVYGWRDEVGQLLIMLSLEKS